MAAGAIVFAMANPVPEVQPEDVRDDVAIMATGRSDYPNQINNVLAFPGVFKGALDVRARTINEEMKLAAAHAIASVIADDELHPEYIIPSVTARSPNLWRTRSRMPPSPAVWRGGTVAPRRTSRPRRSSRCDEPRSGAQLALQPSAQGTASTWLSKLTALPSRIFHTCAYAAFIW
jgi:hypothetical protein